MNLQAGKFLKNGEYRIEKVLGQGGFGITYLGEQVYLGRRVAIKEFFMDGFCNRDAATSHVSVPTASGKSTVERFRRKFIREAQNIARLKHAGIIPVIDVFEDNGTAYYVMEFLAGGSLNDKVKNGAISEVQAVKYIRQVAAALEYVHRMNMLHLDIKPGNILLDGDDNAVIIDFGLAKQYDDSGHQVSTTPVGISHGYAPIEQYRQGGVENFSPATDIYSLGATLYKLVTGITPPDVSYIMSGGMKNLPDNLSPSVRSAITGAMQPAMESRPQSVKEFLALLNGRTETVHSVVANENNVAGGTAKLQQEMEPKNHKKGVSKAVLFAIIAAVLIVAVSITGVLMSIGSGTDNNEDGAFDGLVEIAEQEAPATEEVASPDSADGRETERLLAEQKRTDSIAAAQRYADSIAVVEKEHENERIAKEKAAKEEKERRMKEADGYYNKGNDAYRSNDYANAVMWYRKAAELGHYGACNELGIFYEYGLNGEKDMAAAFLWYKKSADGGNYYGQYNLGRCYQNGTGVAQNHAQAIKLYKKSSKQGCAMADYNLGVCYTNGFGVEVDHATAAKYYLKAANNGVADAQNNLGYYYQHGIGVEQNIQEAVKWYNKAIAQGHKMAAANLKTLQKQQ